ncbi:MAG: hypothetical protein KG012_09400 [Deltaproteobacteria bacterium]|nr:hypothetical protein [Deltaproteobacteria bacterium]
MDEKRLSLSSLKGRQDKMIADLADKKFQLETAMMEHQRLQGEVSLGQAPEKDLFRVAKEIEELKLQIQELELLNSSFPKARDSLETEIRKAENICQGLTHDFWYHIMELEKEKAKGNTALLRAWAAFNLSGGGASFGQFLSKHFNSYFVEDVEKISKELEAEYLKGGDRNG